jgi:hypothetical protein
VLIDIARRQVDRTINLGDCVSGPLWPHESKRIDPMVPYLPDRGRTPSDRGLPRMVRSSEAMSRSRTSDLGAGHRHWLGALPASADSGNGIATCHGTPTNDNQYLIEEVSDRRFVRARLSVIQERLGGAHGPPKMSCQSLVCSIAVSNVSSFMASTIRQTCELKSFAVGAKVAVAPSRTDHWTTSCHQPIEFAYRDARPSPRMCSLLGNQHAPTLSAA